MSRGKKDVNANAKQPTPAKELSEELLRECLDATEVIREASTFLEQALGERLPKHVYHYGYESRSELVSRHIGRKMDEVRARVEIELVRFLNKPEPGLFDRLLKAKCEGRG